MKAAISIIICILIMMVAGCEAPTCYPPNKIIGNKCCLDENHNEICDYEEETLAEEAEEEIEEQAEMVEDELEDAEEREEPQIQQVEMPEPAPIPTGLVEGKQDMRPGESRDYLTLHKMSAFRTSRDKGMMDYMVITVRNPSQKKLNAIVELFFEGARLNEYETRVKKEYTIPELDPGEKYVLNQSLGIRFAKINESKSMTLKVYEKYVAPREDLGEVKRTFVPTDYMESMDIYYYGRPE